LFAARQQLGAFFGDARPGRGRRNNILLGLPGGGVYHTEAARAVKPQILVLVGGGGNFDEVVNQRLDVGRTKTPLKTTAAATAASAVAAEFVILFLNSTHSLRRGNYFRESTYKSQIPLRWLVRSWSPTSFESASVMEFGFKFE